MAAREEAGPILNGIPSQLPDIDPEETKEWLDSLDGVIEEGGRQRARYVMLKLLERAREMQVGVPSLTATDYINTISPEAEPWFPGDEEVERRYRAYLRWNAARHGAPRPAPPASASAATSPPTPPPRPSTKSASTTSGAAPTTPAAATRSSSRATPPPACTPAPSSRAGSPRTSSTASARRRATSSAGQPLALPSYPHPRLMPDFWQFPTVSMGIGPMNAIYQAQFNKYLHNRGVKDTSQQHVWAFLGDGEMDEPESRGLLQLAAGEELDNLTFVINCNLQRLDGPVRGNGKIIQELESFFRGAGWNVIKVVWGRGWDPLLAQDRDGALVHLMNTTSDGDYQTFRANDGKYVRDFFFGRDPRTREMVKDWSDEDIWWKLKRGGHDYRKVFAAYQAAMNHNGQPTVILAKTIKGYGLGTHFAGRNATHQMKKLTLDDLKGLRDSLKLPISDELARAATPTRPPYFHPGPDDPSIKYLRERREKLGGPLPVRRVQHEPLKLPDDSAYAVVKKGTGKQQIATTMAFVRLLKELMRDKEFGKRDRADHPRRGAHLRHGLVLPDDQDLQPARAELHLGRRRADARLQGGQGRPDPAPRHQRGRVDGCVHRRRHVLRHARRADDPDLRLLLDVRVPAHRRLDLGRRRPDDPRLPHRGHGRPHHPHR